jgi:hypothetical protein
MIKQYLLFAGLLFSVQIIAQTGIGTTTPNASAKLDIFSDTKGFLPPRVALTSTSIFSPITGLSDASSLLTAVGLLVYNTATAGSNPNNVTPGYYYWNGTSWIRLIVPTDNSFNVTGTVAVANGGTGTTTGSITGTGALTFTAGGTNQNINLSPSGTGNVVTNSKVGIGTNSPSATLEIGSSNGSVPGFLVLNPTTTGTGVEGAEINLKPAPFTTSPAAQTWVIDQVSNANNPRLRIFPTPSGEATGFTILDNGNFGIGTSTPTEKLEINGSVKASSFIGTASSALSAPTNITYGEINVPQNLNVVAGGNGFTNLVDIPLPSAGTYRITYIARVSVANSATLAVLLLRDGSNVQIGGSEATPLYNLAGVQVMSTMTTYVTISSAQTYKFSAWVQAGAGNLQIINDGNGRSKVLWEKIN